MMQNSIPNIQISKTKINRTSYFDGSVLVELPEWMGYWNNYECTERKEEVGFWIGIKNDLASHEGFKTNKGQVNAYYYLIEEHDKIKQGVIKSLKLFLSNMPSNEYSDWEQTDFPDLLVLTPEFDFKK
ncbi:MAG: hypothetical protein JNN12_14230 [Bacteroidetes Order II. Incertae sedis bacterium]|nr:hypothetical protein [Bacteroidetes Order II. bacterium]